jgi:dihydrodipicolinate synthase/N-acetylneuraminate lyase
MFEGIFTSLITPFNNENKVDLFRLENLLSFLKEKVHGFFILGTYGSTALLNEEEKIQIIDKVVENKLNKPVIVHVGSSNPNVSLELAKYAQNKGVDAVAFVPPYFYNYQEDEIISYFQKIVKEITIPAFVYLNPPRVGYNLSVSCVEQLARIGVYGVKDTTNNLNYFYDLCATVDLEKFNYLNGSELYLNPTMLHGGKGAISAMSNAFPEYVVDVYNALKNGNMKDYKEKMNYLFAYRKIRKLGQGIPIIHAILNLNGINVGYPRFPFKYDENFLKKVKDALERQKIFKREGTNNY